MNKNQFDFKDLMAFGTFIIALLSFIFMNLNASNKVAYVHEQVANANCECPLYTTLFFA